MNEETTRLGNTRVVETSPEHLRESYRRLAADGYRLALVAAHHDPPTAAAGEAMRIVYLLVAGPPDSRIELHVTLPADQPAVPSLADLSFPASRFEREMRDLFGIEPTGHPQPARLVLHQHWPDGWHPMRRRRRASPAIRRRVPALPVPHRRRARGLRDTRRPGSRRAHRTWTLPILGGRRDDPHDPRHDCGSSTRASSGCSRVAISPLGSS